MALRIKVLGLSCCSSVYTSTNAQNSQAPCHTRRSSSDVFHTCGKVRHSTRAASAHSGSHSASPSHAARGTVGKNSMVSAGVVRSTVARKNSSASAPKKLAWTMLIQPSTVHSASTSGCKARSRNSGQKHSADNTRCHTDQPDTPGNKLGVKKNSQAATACQAGGKLTCMGRYCAQEIGSAW